MSPPTDGRLSLISLTLLALERLCEQQPGGKTAFSAADIHEYIVEHMAAQLGQRRLAVDHVSMNLCKHAKDGHAARVGSGRGVRYRRTTKGFREGYRRRSETLAVRAKPAEPVVTVDEELEDWLFGRKPAKAKKRQSKEVAW